MLAYPTELKTRIVQLLEDVGPLALVSGIGFDADDEGLLADNLRAVREGGWRFVELPAEPDGARLALVGAWREEAVVVLVPDALPRPLIELVRAFIDKRDEVDLGDFEKRRRRADQSLVLLVKGASMPEHVPAPLRHVPCWEFLP
ncbi:MAG: hypothetical protein RMA76_23925 [Deltaproteobacteria bacterium]|jgi:hypothetical protein